MDRIKNIIPKKIPKITFTEKLILFTKHKNKYLKILLISSFWGYVLIVGIYGGEIYTKQEIFTLPLLVLIGMITIFQKKN
mgnify:CR=1 FL=1